MRNGVRIFGRRGLLALSGVAILGIAVVLMLIHAASRSTAGVPKDFNVLLITIDTLRADRLGCYGYRQAATPTLDALASQGTRFSRAYAHNVVTLPSHCNILTGLYPTDHGVHDLHGFRLPDRIETLGTILKAKGFSTAAIVGAYPLDARFGLARGFDLYDDVKMAGVDDPELYGPTRRADEVASRFLAWLDGQGTKRWFAWVHFFDPHYPYDPPEPFRSRFKESEYDGEVAYVDSQLARIIERLKAANLTARTLIVVTGDHGEALGDHGELTHGFFAYDATLRIPLIVAMGARFHSVSPVESNVGHVDILPTILELAGITVPAGARGRSLVPLLEGRKRDSAGPIYFESLSANLNLGWAPLQGVVSGDMKYIDLPVRELYELPKDPAESRNLASQGSPTSAYLAALDKIRSAAMAGGTAEPMSHEMIEQLRNLGYLATDIKQQPKSYTAEDDPKKLIGLANAMWYGAEAMKAGDFKKAVEEFQSVIERRPEMALPYVRLAAVYEKMGSPDSAVAILQRSIEHGAALTEGKVMLGRLLGKSGKSPEAVRVLEAAATEAPDDIDALTQLGAAYAQIGKPDMAIQTFRRILAVDPDDARAHSNIGTVYLGMGRQAEAVQELSLAIGLDPKLVDGHNTLGAAYAMVGNYDAALKSWKRVLELAPHRYDTIYNIATLYLQQGRKADALPYVRMFVEGAPARQYQADIEGFRRLLEESRAE